MNNNFESVYVELEELEDKYNDTENEFDKKEYRKAYQAKLSTMPRLFHKWKEAKDNGNENIDFDDIIRNPEELVAELKKNGITEFTFSSGWSSAVETSFAFVKAGCTLVGMTEIKGRYDAFTKVQKKRPAYIFKVA